jgi:hypothetical protein
MRPIPISRVPLGEINCGLFGRFWSHIESGALAYARLKRVYRGPDFVVGLKEVGISLYLGGSCRDFYSLDSGGAHRLLRIQISSCYFIWCLFCRTHNHSGVWPRYSFRVNGLIGAIYD